MELPENGGCPRISSVTCKMMFLTSIRWICGYLIFRQIKLKPKKHWESVNNRCCWFGIIRYHQGINSWVVHYHAPAF